MKNVGYVLKLALTLLIITAVVAGLLGLVNYITVDRIAQNTAEKTAVAMQNVLPIEGKYEPMEKEAYAAFAAGTECVTAMYRAGDKGYIVQVNVNGFGGAINMVVGVDPSKNVTGVSIVSNAETSGLGANCSREDFRSQYIGQSGTLAVSKDGGEIEALTGATVTSRAVTRGVNLAIECVGEVLK